MAGAPEEYFEATRQTGAPPHPGEFLGELPRTGAGIRDDPTPPDAPAHSSLKGLAGYREHLERTFEWGTTANGVFGAKLMFSQLAELEALAGELPEYAGRHDLALLDALFQRPLYVWVTRQDKVRQAVSMWRALQSRRWRACDDDRAAGGGRSAPEPVYRYEGIDHLVRRLENEDAAWGELFARADRTHSVLRITYEDELEREPAGAVAAVLERLGLTVPAGWRPAAPTTRQADARSEDWVATYHRDRAQRGTGHARSGAPPVPSR